MSVGGYDYHRHEDNVETYTIPYDDEGGLYRINIKSIKVLPSY
jgi:hypothetical protein